MLERIWIPESEARGYIVVSPIAPPNHFFFGERDVEWLTPIQRQSELLDQKGLRVHFTIEPGEGHGIQTLAGEGAHRLFDQIGILGTDTEFLYFRNSVSVPRIPSDPEFQKFNRAPTVNL